MDRRRADFDTFVAASTDSLMRTAYLIVGDLQDAEDLVQETLLKVAGRWHRVRRMEHPVAYARRILVNRALNDAGRRTRRRRELTGEALPDRFDDTDEPLAFDAHDELLKVLATLPTRQRTAIVLRYFLDLPEAEVAAAMKCSLGTVKSTAARGLARLEQALRTTNDKRSIST
ncbi:MAG TPA: SigE family RNA polymerase sigma factor [Solirubrobacteraceae bacterium]|jgi:RNA polymerase sigma-70 factor (sigma-E family)|nr:SigE family RNA polymerase sigma factor [Solirubrobacteraceae bacterium]